MLTMSVVEDEYFSRQDQVTLLTVIMSLLTMPFVIDDEYFYSLMVE